jgi:hypothetical protein
MALLDDLKTRRDAIGAELALLGVTKAGGKPNTSGSNTVDHVGYKDGLYRELAELNRLIALEEGPDKDVRYGVV